LQERNAEKCAQEEEEEEGGGGGGEGGGVIYLKQGKTGKNLRKN